MPNYLKILYEPKSILGLLTAVGLLFLMLSGLSMPIQQNVSQFFLSWGKILLTIGISGWLLFVIPAILRNWSRLLGK
jgi:hypothetical protein